MGIRAKFLALISVLLMLVGGPAWAASLPLKKLRTLLSRLAEF